MNDRSSHQEDGASLVMVLIFISVFAVIAAALLTEGGASVKYTGVVSAHEDKVYDADAGVAIGIQQLRQNNNLCPTAPGAPMTIPIDPAFGSGMSVTCEGASGSAWGADGFAIVVTSSADNALKTTNGPPKTVQGPVYVKGALNSNDLKKDLDITRGNFYQSTDSGCSVGDAAPIINGGPGGGVVNFKTPGYGSFCTDEAMPDPKHAPPGPAPGKSVSLPTGHRDPKPVTVSGQSCTIWYPGLYETPPVLAAGDNYFASGIYYFLDGEIRVGAETPPVNQYLWAGEPSPGDVSSYTDPAVHHLRPACANDAAAGSFPEVSGTGAQFAFANSARLYVGKNGQVEVFTRVNDSGTGTNGVSFIAIPNETAWTDEGWAPSTVDTLVLNSDGGNGANVVLHSLVYAAQQEVRLYANGNIKAQILGGIIARGLTIDSTASICSDCMAVSVKGGTPPPRRVLVKATAPGAGGKPVESSAIAVLSNDPAVPAAVESWKTRSPID